MVEGHFIVIEGIDGAGTTTVAQILCDRLRADRRPVHLTREPTSGPVGSIIRLALTHRLVLPGMAASRAPRWSTMALLFAADRLDHLEVEILPNLRDGITVVSDRYDLSSLAYQSATSPAEDPDEADRVIAWIREMNRYATRPDLTVVLDVPADVAHARRRLRGPESELFDDADLQARLAAAYARAERLVPGDHVVHVDATRPVGDVVADVVAAVRALDGSPT